MLVGRGPERRMVEDQLDAAFGGRGRVLLVEGEAGIGKSSLLAAAAVAAESRGAAALIGVCDTLGAGRPFGPLLDAIAAAGWPPPALREPRARGAGLQRSPPFETGPELRTILVEELAALLESRCQQTPVLLCLDDLQWADAATLVAIASLARRIRDQSLLIVMAARPAPRSPELVALLDTLSRVDRPLGPVVDVIRIDLAPLDEDDVKVLAARSAGGSIGANLQKLLMRCDGNPLLILELLSSLGDAGGLDRSGEVVDLRADAATHLPTSFTEVVRSTVARFEGETRALAVLASLLGGRFDLADLGAVTGRPVTDLFPFAQELVEARLLQDDGRGLAFRHDLVREAVADALPPSLRAELHRTIAAQLQAAGAPTVRVAQHVALGAAPGSTDAVLLLREAAAEIAPQDPSGAAALLRRAVEVCAPTDALHDAVTAELIDALAWSGRTEMARAMADEMLRRPLAAEVEERVRSALGRSLLLLGRPLEAVPHEERLVQLHASLGWSVAWAQAESAACRLFGFELDAALDEGRMAVELGTQDHDAMATVLGLCVESFAHNCLGDSATALDLASQAVVVADSTPHREGHRLAPHLFRAIALISSGDKRGGLESCRVGRSLGDALGAVWAGPVYHFVSALAHWDLGAWDDVLAEVDAGIQFGDEYGSTIGQVWALAVAGRVHLYRGDLDAAQALLDRGDTLVATGGLQVGVDWQVLSGALLLEARGRPVDAAEHLCLGWDGAAGLGAQTSLVHFGAELARLAVKTGDPGLARKVTSALSLAWQRCPTDRLLQARLLRAEGLVDADCGRLVEAALTFDAIALPVEAAITRAEAADLLLTTGGGAEAGALLDAALRVFDEVGAHGAAERARSRMSPLLRAARGRPSRRAVSGWEALTPTEREVAEEVCAGRSNGEVADRLGISRRTVEAHLRSIYAKLGVSTRLALAVAHRSRT